MTFEKIRNLLGSRGALSATQVKACGYNITNLTSIKTMSNFKRILSKTIGMVLLIRPMNGVLGAFSALVGAYLVGGVEGLVILRGSLFLATSSVFLIMSGGNVLNDFFDLEIDRINRPRRPLPSGKVKRGEALLLSILLSLLGISLSFFIHLWDFFIAILASLSLFLYNLLLKKKGIAGNLLVSFLSGIVFLYGGFSMFPLSSYSTQTFFYLFFPFVFAFLFHLGREVIKDVADMEGDRKWNARTLPLQYGRDSALAFSRRVFLFLVLISPLPYIFQYFNLLYLLLVLVGVDLFLLVLLLFLYQNPSPGRLSMAGVLLKADMVVGLLALVFGRV